MLQRRVTILAFSGFQTLDVFGPLEVFDAARRAVEARSGHRGAYRIEIVGETADPIASSSGVCIVPHRTVGDGRDEGSGRASRIDTLIVAGGSGSRAACTNPVLVDWLSREARSARRVCSVCTGAFVLAAAGLLDSRRVATHWAAAKELAEKFPAVEVDAESIYVRDGRLWTSAGVTAGMDLSLALVEEDFGSEVALVVARYLVLYVRRPGGQSQWSAQLATQSAERRPLRELQAWIVEHPGADLSVPALAARSRMSVRHFARAFKREIGVTPADYVEATRLEVARRLLETTDFGMDHVAEVAGFGTVETLRRSFARRLRTSPGDYRRRFQPVTKEDTHGDRDSHFRAHHRARRHRTLRGSEPPTGSSRPVRRQTTRRSSHR